MIKETYIITNYDNEYSKAMTLSEEEANAIKWMIEFADLNYGCILATDYANEIHVL